MDQAPIVAPLDFLVVASHPDDAEIGCGGTILSLKANGFRVGILDLTNGEPTPHGSPEIRSRETDEATKVLGVDWRGNLGLPNRSLASDLPSRKKLAEAFRLLRPKTLLAHYWEDAHPDHVAASQLTDAARFWSKLSKTGMAGEPFHPVKVVYYFAMHLRSHVVPSFLVDISSHHDAKMQALACYRSQFIVGRPTASPTFMDDVRARDRYWGWSLGVHYAEGFAVREPVGLRSLGDLLV